MVDSHLKGTSPSISIITTLGALSSSPLPRPRPFSHSFRFLLGFRRCSEASPGKFVGDMSRSHHHQGALPKLKAPPRALFSCGIFRNCTQSALSPTSTPPRCSSSPPPAVSATTKELTKMNTTTASPPSPLPSASPPHASSQPATAASSSAVPGDAATDRLPPSTSSSSSSSSSTSQSFTQWRFPLHHTHPHQPPAAAAEIERWTPGGGSVPASAVGTTEAFHAAELQFSSGARLPALRLLERALAPEPSFSAAPCPPSVMIGVVAALRDPAAARPAAKVLLALLLAEQNRRTAVEAGAASAAVEAIAAALASRPTRGTTTSERALAALELLCTVSEGAEEVRCHAGAAMALAEAADGMVGRGRECAIGVMAAIYGGNVEDAVAPPTEVARAVVAAMQGECSARGRRKGAQLLRVLQESGRLDLAVAIDGCY